MKNFYKILIINIKKNGIQIYFQDYKHPTYEQLWGDFVPYMSIIDVLFNVGAGRTAEIIMENNIKKKDFN
jgi:hypothetical protein